MRSTQKFKFLLLAISVLSWGACAPQASPDPCGGHCPTPQVTEGTDFCQIRTLDQAKGRETARAFPSQEDRYQTFVKQIEENPVAAIKSWLRSTPTFAQLSSDSQLEVRKIDQAGKFNSGVYEVILIGEPVKYIFKIGKLAEEPNQLWKLKDTALAHPECLLRKDLGFARDLSEEEVRLFPRFPKVLESASYEPRNLQVELQNDSDGDSNASHDRYLILMEAAPGQPLARVSVVDLPQVYEKIGKSVGLFHSLYSERISEDLSTWSTWAHRDLHPSNVIYDPLSDQVTFIDNGWVKDHVEPGWVDYDFHQIAYYGLWFLLTTVEGHAIAVDPKGNQKRAVDSQVSSILAVESHRYNSFVKGYLSVFPEKVQGSIRQAFQKKCQDWVAKFSLNVSQNKTFLLDPGIKDVTDALPWGVQDCMKGRF